MVKMKKTLKIFRHVVDCLSLLHIALVKLDTNDQVTSDIYFFFKAMYVFSKQGMKIYVFQVRMRLTSVFYSYG